jgi:putative ABC transport system permease protein
MALGAERRVILNLVVREGLIVTAFGVVVGAGAAFGAGRVIATYLYGVSPGDPITFVSVGVVLMSVSLLACFLPARRATKVDPIVALRYE